MKVQNRKFLVAAIILTLGILSMGNFGFETFSGTPMNYGENFFALAMIILTIACWYKAFKKTSRKRS